MKKLWLALAVFALAFAIRMPSALAFERVNANTVRIKVLSYNVKGLPAIINPGYDADRFADIGDILNAHRAAGLAPDIVLLQEAFQPRAMELSQHGAYKFVSVGPSDQKIISSGIQILSDFPIEYEQSVLYGDSDCGTWDCFASKGAQIARIQLPGVPFLLTIGNTHAQSASGYNAQRKTQFAQLAHFLKSIYNPDAGLIIGGDFNSKPSFPSYQEFKLRTGLTSVGEVCVDQKNQCTLEGATTQENLLDDSDDQMFFVNGRQVTMRPISVERNFLTPFKGRMLSDHLGYETVFEITWK